MKKCIFWFRKDLRLKDNTALFNALYNNDEVIAVYIIDPEFINSTETGEAKIKFLFDSLTDLSKKLNQAKSRLILRFGKSDEQIIKIAKELDISQIYFNEINDIDSENNNDKIIPLLENFGLEINSFNENIFFKTSELKFVFTDLDKTKIFKEYEKLWKNKFKKLNHETLNTLEYKNFSKDKSILSLAVPDIEDYGISSNNNYPKGGENIAYKLLNDNFNFLSKLDVLRPYIEIGNISIKQVLEKSKTDKNFYKELIDYLLLQNYIIFYDINKENDSKNTEYNYTNFLTCIGSETGIPIVDACFKQINQTSLLNSNIFSYVLNILVNELKINPLWINNYLNHKLINTSSVFFKITMNNISTKLDYDKKYISNYIKHFLPVLKNVPDKFIQSPHKMPLSLQNYHACIIGQDYPYPFKTGNFYQILEI